MAKKSLDLYKNFMFLAGERKVVEEMELERDGIQRKIEFYQERIETIRSTMPFEIRLSMFLIHTEALNNALVTEIESLISALLNRLPDFVDSEAEKVITRVARIEKEFKNLPQNAHDLIKA